MRGLIEEATHEMEDHDKGAMMDVVIIASAQRVEHYEIAAYGTMVTLAKSAGLTEIAELLGETLAEEKQTDEQLTKVAVSEVNPAWIAQARGENENQANSRRKTA
jgi:ferritin-like metal-binding protein YciE